MKPFTVMTEKQQIMQNNNKAEWRIGTKE